LSKSRHVIRPRSVDHNRKLILTTEREESETNLQVPRVPNIAVPVVVQMDDYLMPTKPYHRPGHFHRYLPPSEARLEITLEYEATDEDLEFVQKLKEDLELPEQFLSAQQFERCFDLLEKDCANSQMIPLDRAVNVIKEKRINDLWEDLQHSKTANRLIEEVYKYWRSRREEEKKPLLRRFWKNEGIADPNLKIVFQPRSGPREKMRLRNSRKNDTESFEKMKLIGRHLSQVHNIFQATHMREQLKKHTLKARIASFFQERAEKLGKSESHLAETDTKLVESSKELRARIKPPEVQVMPTPRPIPTPAPEPAPKRPRPEPARKNYLSFELARICSLVIQEGEKLKAWPVVLPKPQAAQETEKEQEKTTTKIKVRGRIDRNGMLVVDRYVSEFAWGRYRDTQGVWRGAEKDSLEEVYDDNDNEDLSRLHKILPANFKNFLKQKKVQSSVS